MTASQIRRGGHRFQSRERPAEDAGPVPEDRQLSGIVERVTYHNAENGFAVLKVKAKGRKDLATVVGRTAAVAPGEKIEASGQWVVDRERGLQFKAETIATAPPASAAGIERYLASGFVKGIGAGHGQEAGRGLRQGHAARPRRRAGAPRRRVAGLSAERSAPGARGLGGAAGLSRRARLPHRAWARAGARREGAEDARPQGDRAHPREPLPTVARGQGHRFPHRRPVRAEPRARGRRSGSRWPPG